MHRSSLRRTCAHLLLLAALLMPASAGAADVDELFMDSLLAGKPDVELLSAGQLDDSRCWALASASDTAACVLFTREGDAATWTLVLWNGARGEVARHALANRADAYADGQAAPGLAAARKALKRERWAPLDIALETGAAADVPAPVALSGGRRLVPEGRRVRLVEGDATLGELDTAAPAGAQWFVFHALRGDVLVLASSRTKARDDASLFGLSGVPSKQEPATAPPTAPPASTCASCPASWPLLRPLLDAVCAGTFDAAALDSLRAHVDAREVDKDGVALLWNSVAAMTGYRFKKYPAWNLLFHGADRASLPPTCAPFFAAATPNAKVPAAVKGARDLIRNYWKTL